LIHSPPPHRPDAASSAKQALRAAALSRRDGLSPQARAAQSAAIAARCAPIAAAARPRCLAGYLPIRSEVDPRPILAAAREAAITIVLPAIADAVTIVFRTWRQGASLVPAGFGTIAPEATAPVGLPDLILLPLVGFDRSGIRLGYGRGFYDRAIAGLHAVGRRPALVGLAFSVQEVPRIPHEPHDVRLDWVVTESETLNLTGKGG
jgi:5-formyltetrahydrofolate cyclo-ligase